MSYKRHSARGARGQILMCVTDNLAVNGTDEYFGLTGSQNVGNEAPNQNPIQRAGIIKEMRVTLAAAPNGATKTRTFTLRVGGVSKALTVTITNAETTGQDMVNAVPVAADDLVAWLSDGGVNTPDASRVYISCVFVPDAQID